MCGKKPPWSSNDNTNPKTSTRNVFELLQMKKSDITDKIDTFLSQVKTKYNMDEQKFSVEETSPFKMMSHDLTMELMTEIDSMIEAANQKQVRDFVDHYTSSLHQYHIARRRLKNLGDQTNDVLAMYPRVQSAWTDIEDELKSLAIIALTRVDF